MLTMLFGSSGRLTAVSTGAAPELVALVVVGAASFSHPAAATSVMMQTSLIMESSNRPRQPESVAGGRS